MNAVQAQGETLPVAILAGGLATRLAPLTECIPKVLLQVAGQPFAAHQLELLRQHGLTRIVFCVGHLGEQVQAALGDGRRWGVNLSYVFDGPRQLGTGGAIRQALPLLGDGFFVLYGDAYLECDYQAIQRAFENSRKLGLMTVYRNEDQWDRSNVEYGSGRVIRYDKRHRTALMRHIDYGLGLFRSAAFEDYPTGQAFDLAHVYQQLLGSDELAAYEVRRRFHEIGSPEGLRETQEYLTRKVRTPDQRKALR